ncbi:septal ring lytic transglycosylase RlpA family protein [Flavobacterium sp. 3HN19-14]|uniref:septal ring lytic transglycosylase RlpA family protein n=1 Tax=Flavobacterium sp. 3HN19-14 TaxID=3448133 RepID=UPI003EE1817A
MKKVSGFIALIAFFSLLASCSSTKNVSGKTYKKDAEVSYYADKFNGNKTSSGEKFNNSNLTAAHRTLAFGTKLKVTNVANNKSVIVKVNDRGPQKKSRELDITKRAFMEITDNKNHGTLKVNIEIIK